MGLPARQLRTLDHIETMLRASDPKLAGLYAIFARLNRDEQMPSVEEVRHRAHALLTRLRFTLAVFLSRLRLSQIRRQPALLFFPLAIAIIVLPIVLSGRSASGNVCAPVGSVVATKYLAKTRNCKSPAPTLYRMTFEH